MRYNNRKPSIYKGSLYKSIREKAEEDFCDSHCDGYNVSIDDCIDSAIDYYWEEILDCEDYDHIEDEDVLADLLFDELSYDIDEDDLLDSLRPDNSYYGLSDYERNPGLWR